MKAGLYIRATLSSYTLCQGKQVLVANPRAGTSELIEIHRIAQRYARLATSLTSPEQSTLTQRYQSVSLETVDGTVIHYQRNIYLRESKQICLPALSLECQPSSKIRTPTAKKKSAKRSSSRLPPSGLPATTPRCSSGRSKASRPSGLRVPVRGALSYNPRKGKKVRARKAKAKGKGKGKKGGGGGE